MEAAMARKKKKKKKYRGFWLFVKLQLLLLTLISAVIAEYYFGSYGKEIRNMREEAGKLVAASTLETFRSNQTSIVYAADGSVISTLKGSKESYYLTIDEMPIAAVSAIVSIEDKKFFRHDGVDYKALVRAVKALIENGEVTQGGSTITMQLARNVFISQEKTWQRKVEEIFIAWDLEEKYTKEQILEFYLNNIYFGNGYYGLQSASRGYFNRDLSELDLSQIAFLCAIPNNPTLYDPLTNMDNTVSRRDRILSNMLEDGKISEKDYLNAVEETIVLERPPAVQKNDYVETYVFYCATRALMENEDFVFRYEFATKDEEAAYNEAYAALYEECQKKLYTAGYQIYTSFDLKLQEQLQEAVDENLASFTEKNDEGIYELQASAVCINNETGYVNAMVGGRKQDFAGYTLNRAYQSHRQPGSSIKPLTVYTPSFERNYTPDSIVVDEPIEDGPKNANGTYSGAVTLRTAVERSINTIAWKLYDELTPAVGLSYLKEMNFSRLADEDYSLPTALGGFTNGASALEMTAAYAAIENDGLFRAPTCIVKIVDASGNEIYASEQEEKPVYKQNAARMMTDVLKGVFTVGTARGFGLKDMPCAGKTGTTNDYKDGWLVGYTRYYTTGVWVGYDIPRRIEGLKGCTYPGGIWQDFMEIVHEGLTPLDFLSPAKLSDEFIQQGTLGEDTGEEEPEDIDEEEDAPEDIEGEEPEDIGGGEPEDIGGGEPGDMEEEVPGNTDGDVPDNPPPAEDGNEAQPPEM